MLHTGDIYTQDHVSIGTPDIKLLRSLSVAEDVRESFPHWLDAAIECDDIVYFTIYLGQIPAGQILLHDIKMETGESLIAYHLFDPALRGRGVGTTALYLL